MSNKKLVTLKITPIGLMRKSYDILDQNDTYLIVETLGLVPKDFVAKDNQNFSVIDGTIYAIAGSGQSAAIKKCKEEIRELLLKKEGLESEIKQINEKLEKVSEHMKKLYGGVQDVH